MQFIEDYFYQIISSPQKLTRLDQISDQALFDLISRLQIKSQELLIVLEELLANSQEHGKPPIEFFYDKILAHFIFALIDHGVGIHQTIPLNQRLSDTLGKSSSALIRLSLEMGISGTSVIGRGMGLFYLSKFVKEHNAEALVACNSGLVLQRMDVFYEKSLPQDINANVVILKVPANEVGL